MKNLSDLFDERRGKLSEGRTVLAQIQAVFDDAFGKGTCLVKVSQNSMVVFVDSAGLASEVQMRKHTLVQDIQGIEPAIRSVRITIGLPRQPQS